MGTTYYPTTDRDGRAGCKRTVNQSSGTCTKSGGSQCDAVRQDSNGLGTSNRVAGTCRSEIACTSCQRVGNIDVGTSYGTIDSAKTDAGCTYTQGWCT